MRVLFLSCAVVAALILAPTAAAGGGSYDVCVYASAPAGVGAAVAASAYSPAVKVVLIEPTAYVGGMAGPGGIGFRDFAAEDLVNDTVLVLAHLNAEHYGVDYPVWQPDSYVMNASLFKVLDRPNIDLVLSERLVEGPSGVTVADRRITELITAGPDGTGTTKSTWSCKYVVDASYEGDVMTFAGVSSTWGRESMAQYNESMAGVTSGSQMGQFSLAVEATWPNGTLLNWVSDRPDPRTELGKADDNVMAYSFRLCLTDEVDNKVPITKPAGYQTSDFELSARYLTALAAAKQGSYTPWGNLAYRSYPPGNKRDACCGAGPVGIDAVGLAVGYSNGTYADRARIKEEHLNYVLGLAYFWQSDPDAPVPASTRKGYAAYGLCKDQWPETGHVPPQLYVREARRMVGDRVYTQNDRIPSDGPGGCRDDSIAVSSWGLDIHGMERVGVTSFANQDSGTTRYAYNEGLTKPDAGGHVTAELPYWILLPKRAEMENLLVPNTPSVSHVAFSAIREEPTLVPLGEAAGSACAISVLNHSAAVHDVHMPTLQAAQRAIGVVLHVPTRVNCSSPVPPPPSTSCNCSEWTVTGAGDAPSNGVYTRAGTYGQYDKWQNTGGTSRSIYVDYHQWRIADLGVSVMYVDNGGLGNCPGTTNWAVGTSGSTPAPTVQCTKSSA